MGGGRCFGCEGGKSCSLLFELEEGGDIQGEGGRSTSTGRPCTKRDSDIGGLGGGLLCIFGGGGILAADGSVVATGGALALVGGALVGGIAPLPGESLAGGALVGGIAPLPREA